MWAWFAWCALAAEPAGPSLAEQLQAVYRRVERFQQIEVEVGDGVVTLSGTVPGPQAREEAERIAAGGDGVWFVDNQLVLPLPEGAPSPPLTDDERIEAQLTGVLSQMDEFQGIEVEVQGGVVHLRGRILDSAAGEQVVELARGLQGVLYVDDDLERVVEVSERLLPTAEVFAGQVRSLVAHLPLVAVAVLLVAGGLGVGRVAAALTRRLNVFSLQPLLGNLVTQMVSLICVLLGVLAALEILDATALVSAVLGTAGLAGLAIGFAFQDIVQNYLAGILLSLQQPFSQNDLVKVGDTTGVVVKLTLRNTLLLTVDGQTTLLPNAMVFKSVVTNFSRHPQRRFEFLVRVSLEEDLVERIRLGTETLCAMEVVLDEPAPKVLIEEIGETRVTLKVLGWVDQTRHDLAAVRTEAMRRVLDAFQSTPEEAGAEPAVPLASDDHVLQRQAEEERARSEGEDLLEKKGGPRQER